MTDHHTHRANAFRRGTAAAAAAALTVALAAGSERRPALQVRSPGSGPDGPAFDSIVIRPNASGDEARTLSAGPGGRFVAMNASLRQLVGMAYDVRGPRLIATPAWADSDRFDIEAVASGNPSPEEIRFMLRRLLADRFALVIRGETRALPVFVLALAGGDGQLGPRMRRANPNCAGTAHPPQLSPEIPQLRGRAVPCRDGVFGPGVLVARGMTLAQVADSLSAIVRTIVADRTGLDGRFDFDLQWKWTPDQLPPRTAGAPPPVQADPNGPSLFEALEAQLGLRLASTTDDVDVLVIERAERPVARQDGRFR